METKSLSMDVYLHGLKDLLVEHINFFLISIFRAEWLYYCHSGPAQESIISIIDNFQEKFYR